MIFFSQINHYNISSIRAVPKVKNKKQKNLVEFHLRFIFYLFLKIQFWIFAKLFFIIYLFFTILEKALHQRIYQLWKINYFSLFITISPFDCFYLKKLIFKFKSCFCFWEKTSSLIYIIPTRSEIPLYLSSTNFLS